MPALPWRFCPAAEDKGDDISDLLVVVGGAPEQLAVGYMLWYSAIGWLEGAQIPEMRGAPRPEQAFGSRVSLCGEGGSFQVPLVGVLGRGTIIGF